MVEPQQNNEEIYAIIGNEIKKGGVLKGETSVNGHSPDELNAFNIEVEDEIYGGFASGDKGKTWAYKKENLE